MNSKIDQLENQPDLTHELRELFKNIIGKERGRETTQNEAKNKLTNTKSIQSNKMLREKIHIELDLLQRTKVFSNEPFMWI
jgi:hypothetical protein